MRYERLRYTRHAWQRMRERDVSEADILRVMNEPDLSYPSYGKRVAEDAFEGGTDARIISAIDLEKG